MNQDDFYNNVEGEAFFQRAMSNFSANNAVLHHELRSNKESILQFISSLTELEYLSVLEVGCSVGDLLYVLREKYHCSVLGVEPSSSASEIARKEFGLEVFQGTLQRSPFFKITESNKQRFDLIILDDVVGWMDPGILLPSLGVLDWALKPAGHLFVRELYSPFPFRVRNSHHQNEEIFQHRYPYGVGSFFLNTGEYVIAGAKEYSTSLLQENLTDSWKQVWRDSLLRKTKSNVIPSVTL